MLWGRGTQAPYSLGQSRTPDYYVIKDRALAPPPNTERRRWPPLLPSSPQHSPGAAPPRWAFQSREEMAWSHFPGKELRREPGPSAAQNRVAFTGPWPKLLSWEATRHKKKGGRRRGRVEGLEVGPGPSPAPGGLCAGWGGRPGMNDPLHPLQGFPAWRLSQTQQNWACPLRQTLGLGGWECARHPAWGLGRRQGRAGSRVLAPRGTRSPENHGDLQGPGWFPEGEVLSLCVRSGGLESPSPLANTCHPGVWPGL